MDSDERMVNEWQKENITSDINTDSQQHANLFDQWKQKELTNLVDKTVFPGLTTVSPENLTITQMVRLLVLIWSMNNKMINPVINVLAFQIEKKTTNI